MKPIIEKILTILFLLSASIGVIGAIIEFSFWMHKWWWYPIGYSLVLLTVLGAMELMERSR